MPKIFVCHRREDTADVTGRIFDRLVMDYGGQQILKDLDSIPLGVDFREYLGRMVGECDVFLAVIGPRWLNAEGGTSRLEDARDFVRIEIESALAREIPIVPLFVGGASMPSEEDVPESIRSFVYRNGVPVRPDPDFHRDMDRVIAGLDGYGRPAPPPPAETATPSRAEPILPADPDSHHDAERERGPTYADRTLADELAAAQERHYAELARLEAESAQTIAAAPRDAQAAEALADERLTAELAAAEERHHAEIARLETEAAESRDAAARDAQAQADAQADDRLTAELARARAAAERTLTDELAAAEERHRADIEQLEAEEAEKRDAAARDAQARAEGELTTLAARLATAEERHHAEIARLEAEAAESRDIATRDAQARAGAQADDRLTAELARAHAAAERTLADELAAAEERHHAEIARLEAEAAESRDIATRDAQARADATLAAEQRRVLAEVELAKLAARLATAEERHHAEIAHLETEAAENRDAATRDARARADTQAGPGRMGSGKRRDTAASDIETPQHHTGMLELPTPRMALTIMIGAEDEVQTVESDPDFDTNIRVFADTDAIRVLRCISRERPRVVVLGRAFVGTLRGAALVNGIKTDRTLANTQIRVIRRVSDYLCLVRRTDPQAASDDPIPGEPLPADYVGTREARRYKLRPGFEARIDGNPTTLVELSGRGAQLVGSTVLRLEQRVRLVMGTAPEVVRCSAIVVWVSFEPQGKRAPRYRAGTQFIDADPKAIQDLLRRHLKH